MLIYTLFKAFTGSADGAVSVTMVRRGVIRSIIMSAQPDLDADGELFSVEVATIPIFSSRTNDATGALCCVCQCYSLTTSGSATSGVNEQFILDYPVEAGQKLYLNGLLTGVGSVPATALVYVR